MGLFETLFDFDGDGKVGLEDDLMFMWITQNVFAEEEGQRSASNSLDSALLYAATQDDEKARKRAAEVVTQRKAQHELNELRRELYAIRIPCSLEQKGKSKEAIEQYTALLSRLEYLMPEDTSTTFYYDCIELRQEIKKFVRCAERVHQILNGEFHDESDPMATRASEIAKLEQETADWEEMEPDDCTSEAWDTWEEKRAEYEAEIESQKEELDWDKLYASFEATEENERNQTYLNAYADSTRVLEKAQICIERLEQLVRVAHKILERSTKAASEQYDQINDAIAQIEWEEPDKASPKWDAWRKRLSELEKFADRLGQVAYLGWEPLEDKTT